MSRLGVTSVEFYAMTPAEFHYAIADHTEQEKMGMELNIKTTWETTRMMMYHSEKMNPYLKKKPKKPTDVMKFTWEEPDEDAKVQTMKQALEQIHVTAFLNNRRKQGKSNDISKKKRK